MSGTLTTRILHPLISKGNLKLAYFIQSILKQTLRIVKLSHVHVCNCLTIEQHDCGSVFVRKFLKNVICILAFLSTLWII